MLQHTAAADLKIALLLRFVCRGNAFFLNMHFRRVRPAAGFICINLLINYLILPLDGRKSLNIGPRFIKTTNFKGNKAKKRAKTEINNRF